MTQDQFISRPNLPDKILVAVWGPSQSKDYLVSFMATPMFEVQSGQLMRALLLFGNQDFYELRVPLRTDVEDSTVLVELGDSAGAILIDTYEPYNSIIILYSKYGTPNFTLPAANFTTGYVNLKITASGEPASAIVSATITQQIPVDLSSITNMTHSNVSHNVTGSSDTPGSLVFSISLPGSTDIWKTGVFVTVVANSGDPDLYVSIDDEFVKTSDWSSRRYGDDSLGVPLDPKARPQQTKRETSTSGDGQTIYVSVEYNTPTNYTLLFSPLLPAIGSIYVSSNISAHSIRTGTGGFYISLNNTQYRFVDWVASNDETVQDIIMQIVGSSHEATAWNALISPLLLNATNNTAIQRIDDWTLYIAVPATPLYNTSGEFISMTNIPASAVLPGVSVPILDVDRILVAPSAPEPPTPSPTSTPTATSGPQYLSGASRTLENLFSMIGVILISWATIFIIF